MTLNEIKDLFIELTTVTMPHGTERELFKPFADRFNLESDSFGNYFIKIGDSRSIFTCHIDTVGSKSNSVVQYIMTRVNDGRIGIQTDGATILGADDKAGVCVLLNMVQNNIPGLYYFFLGEECGAHGSRAALTIMGDELKNYDRVVSFDRRGYKSIITEQAGGTCCSNEFALALAKELNSKCDEFVYAPDPTGLFTDSAVFMKDVPECTNISVGYFNEHTTKELQDLNFLYDLAEATLTVEWEKLPVVRDHLKVIAKPEPRRRSVIPKIFRCYIDLIFILEDFYPLLEDREIRQSEADVKNKTINLYKKGTNNVVCSVSFRKGGVEVSKNGKTKKYKTIEMFGNDLYTGALDGFLDHRVIDKQHKN